MADVTMKDFVLQFYMQWHLDKMSPEQFASFQDACKKDDLTKGMKDWKKKLMQQTPNGLWVANDLPNPHDRTGKFYLTDAEWEKFFRAFQDAFRNMAANKKDITETAALNFLNENFGGLSYNLFDFGTASANAVNQISDLKRILDDTDFEVSAAVQYYIQSALKEGGISLKDLKKGISEQKYNKDAKFRDTLQNVAASLRWPLQSEDALKARYSGVQLDAIIDDFEDKTIDPAKLDRFKGNPAAGIKGEYEKLLLTLYADNKIFDVFKEYDKGKISGPLESAKTDVEYNKGDNQVPPKRDDRFTPWQQMNRWVGKTWKDYMGKYMKLKPDHAFLSPQAQAIMDAFDGTTLKPTDGLAKIVDGFSNIKKGIKSPTALAHFKWFEEAMTEFKSDKQLSSLFERALRNGSDLKELVSELFIKAIKDNKIDEAKTAAECLHVMQYTHTTSKTMDALGQEKFSIFSDGKLSWNKNEGMSFVTTALDKSIKTAFMAVGYGVTIVANTINLSGRKFNNKLGRMAAVYEGLKDEAGRSAAIADRDTNNPITEAERNREQAALDNLRTVDHIEESTLSQREADLAGLRTDEKTKKTLMEQAAAERDIAQGNVNDNQSKIDEEVNLLADQANLAREITQIDGQINTLRGQINALGGVTPATTALANSLQQQIDAFTNQRRQKFTEYTNVQNRLNDPARQAEVRVARANSAALATELARKTRAFNTAEGVYNTAHTDAEDLSDKLGQYHKGTAKVKDLTDLIDKRNKTVSDWDKNHQGKLEQLMAWWDALSQGDSYTPGSKKRKQEAMNAQRDAYLAQIYSDYGNVA